MLLVETKLGVSSIPNAGIGLFADQFIPKDTIIWKYTSNFDKIFYAAEFDGADGLSKDFMQTYCFKFDGHYILCGDNGRFFNHSDSPNCYSEGMSKDSIGYTKALRDIEIGEELTDDYTKFGLNAGDEKFNRII